MRENLKVVFMGTPDFAVPSLARIHEAGYDIVGVITVADKPAGRGKKLRQSPVKVYAVENDLHVLQPTNLKDPDFVKELAALKADLQVVVAFRMLPEVVWNMPPLGTINLHGSLLPQYRGAAPINWAVINGETKTGVTTFFLQHAIDTGNIIQFGEQPIAENDTAGDIHDAMMEMGAQVLLDTVNNIKNGTAQGKPQEDFHGREDELKKAPKIFKEDCKIDWNAPMADVHNFVRGLSPFPGAYTFLENGEDDPLSFKILKTTKTDKKSIGQGAIETTKDQLFISCADGVLEVLSLQLQGKKRMETADFLRGLKEKTLKIHAPSEA